MDDEPVYYCKACMSLHIIVDSQGNDICGSCAAENFVSVVPFDKYQKLVNDTQAKP